jgi:hypothetical protein
LPWVIRLPFYFIYETAINIYYFYHQLNGNNRYNGPLDGGFPLGFSVVPLVYWITKAIILFTSFVYLVVRLQSVPASPRMKYVRQVDSFHEYDSAPSFPHHPPPMISLPPAPSIPKPSSPQCTSCSGGCSADRCNKCNLPQPLYGYAGMPKSNTGVNIGNYGMSSSGMGNAGINLGNYGMGSSGMGNAGAGMGNAAFQLGTSGIQNAGNCAGAVQSKGWTTSVFNAGR